MIAIHNNNNGFHKLWVDYCTSNNIKFKRVNCYANDIIQQLEDCTALMWHHSHVNARDILVSSQLTNALQHTGFKVFPDWNTAWHFDDKVAQKYLLERIKAPMVPSYVFYDRKSAEAFIEETDFPIVWKIRKGAGSSNVRLVRDKNEAFTLINKAFTSGFKIFNKKNNFKESIRKFSNSKSGIIQILKSTGRLFIEPEFSKISQKEIGYIYFQKFIPNNSFDIRIISINGKSFGLKRFVRKGDFRASGSGDFSYNKDEFDINCVKIANSICKQLSVQCIAFDFVFSENNKPLIVEISYGFSPYGYNSCPGYWDEDLNWIEGQFNPYGWMVNLIINKDYE